MLRQSSCQSALWHRDSTGVLCNIQCKKCKNLSVCAFAALKVETISGEGDIKRMLCRQREHMEKTVSDLRTKLAKSAEEHDKAYVRIMKVKKNDFLINLKESHMIVPLL